MKTETDAIPQDDIKTLVEYVVSRHHEYLRENFPRLLKLSAEIAKSHGSVEPRLQDLDRTLQAFANETLGHLDKEEMMLFPMCIGLGQGRRPGMPPTVRMPIQRMLQEHEGHLEELERLAYLTDQYVARGDLGDSHKSLVDGLRALSDDLRRHIQTENDILFPWALRLESQLR